MNRNILASILILLLFAYITHNKLIYTFSLIRHGAQYPKNDLYDGNQTKQFRGQLTGVGMRQQYNLGTYLKQDYITTEELTTSKFNPNHVEFFSTTYQRTQNSVLSFIYGFYPLQEGWTIPQEVPYDKLDPPFTPLTSSHLNDEIQTIAEQPFALNQGFQAVPVRPLDDILDNCPSYGVLISSRYKQIAQPVATFQAQQSLQISKMKVVFNLTALQTTVQTMSDLYQTIVADQYLGRSLPKDYDQNDNKNMRYISDYYNTLIYDGNFAKVLTTPFLRFLRSKLNQASKKTSSNKMSFVVGHQSNLHPLLTQLNLTSTACLTQKWKGQQISALNCMVTPIYASNIIFELHQDDSFQHFIKIKYNGEYVYLCEAKQTKCLYEEFIERVKNIETDFEKQCGINSQSNMIITEQ